MVAAVRMRDCKPPKIKRVGLSPMAGCLMNNVCMGLAVRRYCGCEPGDCLVCEKGDRDQATHAPRETEE
jgi:hypothetical protein